MKVPDRQAHIPRLLQIAEHSLTVRDVAVTDLWYADPERSSAEVRAELERQGFDAAPVRETPRHRYVEPEWLPHSDLAIELVARPIDASQLITIDLPLVDAVQRLRDRVYYFVLGRDGVTGIVTRADLVFPPVSLVALGLILSIEAEMDRLIEGRLGSSWMDQLSAKRRGECLRQFEARQGHNIQITPLQCLMLVDRIALIRKNAELWGALGFATQPVFDDWAGSLHELRNSLAHGGSIFTNQPDPIQAIDAFLSLRHFAERIWRIETSAMAEGLALRPPVGSRREFEAL